MHFSAWMFLFISRKEKLQECFPTTWGNVIPAPIFKFLGRNRVWGAKSWLGAPPSLSQWGSGWRAKLLSHSTAIKRAQSKATAKPAHPSIMGRKDYFWPRLREKRRSMLHLSHFRAELCQVDSRCPVLSIILQGKWFNAKTVLCC